MTYHNSPNGPRRCNATVQACPYGKAGEPHFETQAAAQEAYEAKMSETFGNVETLKRSGVEKLRQNIYSKRDGITAKVNLVKAKVDSAENSVRNGLGEARENARQNIALEVALAKQDYRNAKAKTQRFFNKVRGGFTKASAAVKAIGDDLTAARAKNQEFGRLRNQPASDLRPGDTIQGRRIHSTGHRNGNTTVVFEPGANGAFSSSSYGSDDLVVSRRLSKRELRSNVAHRVRSAKVEAYRRVSEASVQQKQVFNTLAGIDRSKAIAKGGNAFRTAAVSEKYNFSATEGKYDNQFSVLNNLNKKSNKRPLSEDAIAARPSSF